MQIRIEITGNMLELRERQRLLCAMDAIAQSLNSDGAYGAASVSGVTEMRLPPPAAPLEKENAEAVPVDSEPKKASKRGRPPKNKAEDPKEEESEGESVLSVAEIKKAKIKSKASAKVKEPEPEEDEDDEEEIDEDEEDEDEDDDEAEDEDDEEDDEPEPQPKKSVKKNGKINLKTIEGGKKLDYTKDVEPFFQAWAAKKTVAQVKKHLTKFGVNTPLSLPAEKLEAFLKSLK